MEWELVESGSAKASLQMEKERFFLKHLKHNSSPLLHFYDFESESVTYGHFCNPEKLLNVELLLEEKIELTKRVTGGGISFHFSDFTFSLLIPASHPKFSLNTLQNYAFVNHHIREALSKFLGNSSSVTLFFEQKEEALGELSAFCMAKPIQYDLINSKGLKIGGGALRLKKQGFLYQGTLNLRPKDETLLKGLIRSSAVFESIKKRSDSLFRAIRKEELEIKKKELIFFLKDEFLKIN